VSDYLIKASGKIIMNNSDETLEQSTQTDMILQAITELSKQLNERIDNLGI
jgi:hypothetical protein